MDLSATPSYDDLHAVCDRFVESQAGLHAFPEAIVGLMRGGMFNAVRLSHLYNNAPVITVDYSAVGGAGDNIGTHANVVPEIRKHRLLIVDDICDSGYTLQEVTHAYRARGHIVTTMSTYWKNTSQFKPDWYATELSPTSDWITFPWEIEHEVVPVDLADK